jgi:hypothetical protein
MLFRNVKLGDQPSKLTHDLTLLQKEKCIVKAFAGTLTLPILHDELVRGYVFAGNGQLTLDAIVETPRGAVGKPLIKDLNQPFIMIGKIGNFQESSALADAQDISKAGYASLEEFKAKISVIFNRFFGHSHTHLDSEDNSCVFAFVSEQDKWDMLISKGNKLVYTSKDKVYISKDKIQNIVIGPEQVLVAGKGKTVVIANNDILVDRHKDS